MSDYVTIGVGYGEAVEMKYPARARFTVYGI
jgi:hypothetical protein